MESKLLRATQQRSRVEIGAKCQHGSTTPWPETRKGTKKAVVSGSGAKGGFLLSQLCAQPEEETYAGPG